MMSVRPRMWTVRATNSRVPASARVFGSRPFGFSVFASLMNLSHENEPRLAAPCRARPRRAQPCPAKPLLAALDLAKTSHAMLRHAAAGAPDQTGPPHPLEDAEVAVAGGVRRQALPLAEVIAIDLPAVAQP